MCRLDQALGRSPGLVIVGHTVHDAHRTSDSCRGGEWPVGGSGGRRRLCCAFISNATVGNAALREVDQQGTGPMWSGHMSSSSMPPRWQRLMFGLAPMVGLSVLALSAAAVEIAASESTVVDILLLICTAALIPAIIMAIGLLTAERYASTEMQSRYETLLALLTSEYGAGAPLLVNPRAGVAILGVDEPARAGRERELVRFAMTDDCVAPDGTTYRVYERFTLHAARPVVLHRVDAMSMLTDLNGEHRARLVPRPERTKRDSSRTARMIRSTGINVATTVELDVLIEQIRSASATPAA
jgi:hypothetical protein